MLITFNNLVADNKRSWHAGTSQRYHDTDLNNSSTGIEIVDLDGNITPYTEKKIQAVIFLVKQLLKKYDVEPVNIIDHSDTAPTRKDNPLGSLFPWKQIYNNGIGAWYDEEDFNRYQKEITTLPSIKTDLKKHSYKISVESTGTAIDLEYKSVVTAFQRHFNPTTVSGTMTLHNYIVLESSSQEI